MILKEYLSNLCEYNDDLMVIYSIDDEGNAYHEIYFEPTIMYVHPNDESEYVGEEHLKEWYEEYKDEMIDEDMEYQSFDEYKKQYQQVLCIN